MNENVIAARLREPAGKGGARQIRLHGSVPGVFYAHNEQNLFFTISTSDLARLMRGSHTIINLQIEGSDPRPCVIRELQRDPVDDKPLHIDLLGLHSGELITVTIPIKLVGIAIGVKESGGILEHGLAELQIECLPGDIPEVVTMDVSNLGLGQSIHVREVSIPNVKLLDDPSAIVAHVASPTVQKEEATAAAEEVPTPETGKSE